MDYRYQLFLDRFTDSARRHGCEPVPGRQPTPFEIREYQQRHQDISNCLDNLRRFEEESRKNRILVTG